MMRTLVSFALFIFCQVSLSAQFIPFAFTYGGGGTDMGYDIIEAPDSGYVCVGQSGSFGYTFGSSDVYVFKTNINGQLLWRRNYGGLNAEGARTITKGHGGGYLIAGYTNSYGNGGYDYWILRIDEQGDTLWSKTYGGSDWDFAYSACTTADGNYLVAGETFSFGAGGSDIWVLKINDSGDTLSSFLWGEGGDQTCREIKEYAPGKAVIAASGVIMPNTDKDAILLGIDHIAHSYVFETNVPYVGDQELTSVDVSHTGGFITFGIHIEEGHTNDLLVQYYTNTGAHSQTTEIAGSNEQYNLGIYSGIKNNHINKYYVAGYSLEVGSSNYEALFFELDPLPYVTMGRVITAPRYNGVQSIMQASDGGIVMAGISEGFGPGTSAALIWKLDSLGQAGGNPLPLLAVEEVEQVAGLSLYPNPFVQQFVLSIPESIKVADFKIWDLQGKLVYQKNITTAGNVVIQPMSLSSGLYSAEITLSSGKRYYSKIIKQNE